MSDFEVMPVGTAARLAELEAEVERLRDSCAAKADRIDRLGETVERLRAQQAEPVAYSIQTPADAKLNRITPSLVTDSQHELQEHLGNSETAKYIVPLYTHPPRREWVPLTDEEIAFCRFEARVETGPFKRDGTTTTRLARAIEAALKEKNV
jgi:hypothetical protein